MLLPGNRAVKKLVIKNFKGQRVPEGFEEASWQQLKAGLQSIFAGKHESISLELLYRTCEDACRCRLAHPLYSKLYAECEEYARSFCPRAQFIVSNMDSERKGIKLLQSFMQVWQEYTARTRIITRVFLYLDRVYVLNRSELVSIWEFCMAHFRNHVMADQSVQSALVSSLLIAIQIDRQAEISEEAKLIAQVIEMLGDLRLFEEWIQTPLLSETEVFYIDEAKVRFEQLDGSRFLYYARNRINDESLRSDNYGFIPPFKLKLIETVRKCIFIGHLEQLLQKELQNMVEKQRIEDLSLLFTLCQETGSVEVLRRAYCDLIRGVGATALADQTTPDENIMAGLMSFKDQVDYVVEKAFTQVEPAFREAVKDAFEAVMNSRHNRPAELLSKYIDFLLKGGSTIAEGSTSTSTSLDEDKLIPLLEKVIIMFRLLQGKDYFEAVFKKDLACRLLFGRSASWEGEKAFVALLKRECGSAFTSRLEGMFKDIEQSKQTIRSYRSLYPITNDTEFAATTIASGLWPHTTPPEGICVPATVQREQEEFEKYYKSKHKGRWLCWHQGLGNVIVKANFPLGTKELQLTIPQALILLAFNNVVGQSELTVSQIKEQTGLDDVTLSKALQSLACGKVNILNKTPRGREVMLQDQFSFNADFTSKHNRIRINMMSEREAGVESLISPGEGSSDRQYLVDAAIVRTLKAHRRMDRDALLRTVNHSIGMTVSEDEFHRRCDSLIDREFIGKNPEDPTVFLYVQ